jgi:hypothetical protein
MDRNGDVAGLMSPDLRFAAAADQRQQQRVEQSQPSQFKWVSKTGFSHENV